MKFRVTCAFLVTLVWVAGSLFAAVLTAQDEVIGGTGYSGGEPLFPDDEGKILGFPAQNTVLLSWLTSEEIVGRPQQSGDLWGWVSPSGREYVFFATTQATSIIEVTDPLRPAVVKVIQSPFSYLRDVRVFDETAYMVDEGASGILVLNLKKIDRGKVRKVRNVTENGLQNVHNLALNPDSGFAYLCGSNIAGGGLVPVDLSDPRNPKVLADKAWSDAYVHNAVVVSFEKGPRAGREIAFAFVPSVVGQFNVPPSQEGGVAILDVTDKDNIFEIKRVPYPNEFHAHSGALNGKGNFLYVNDEADEWGNGAITATQTYILRVRNLERAGYVRTYSNGVASPDHDSFVRRKLLYFANYVSGLRVASIRDPKFPSEIAYFDTYPEWDSFREFQGAFGIYVFPSKTIVVSDQQRGLFVLMRQP